jgi:hypothetical protein
MKKSPEKPPPENSLDRLKVFTKRILQVRKEAISKAVSTSVAAKPR